jgi:hypothetical protein
MIILIISTILVILLCALTYRLGGMSKKEGAKKLPWIPQWLISSWVRDCFCSILSVLWMFINYPHVPWWIYLVSIGATWGMTSMYWKKLFGETNYWFHGFMIGFAFIGFPIFTGYWMAWIVRCLILAILCGGISVLSGNVDVEEYGRGGSIGITLLIMLLRR